MILTTRYLHIYRKFEINVDIRYGFRKRENNKHVGT